jgi:hypothetical protein
VASAELVVVVLLVLLVLLVLSTMALPECSLRRGEVGSLSRVVPTSLLALRCCFCRIIFSRFSIRFLS